MLSKTFLYVLNISIFHYLSHGEIYILLKVSIKSIVHHRQEKSQTSAITLGVRESNRQVIVPAGFLVVI
jgi:hypothetical protein